MRRALSRLYSPQALQRWWVRIPAILAGYFPRLSAAWGDGAYLTAWPQWAMLLSLVAGLLGFIAGATHWSFLTIDATGAASPPAITFAQMLPLLIIAVATGTLSANAGTMLVIGYAIGDYLIAGPQLEARDSTPLSHFLYLRVPQLISYVFFFILAALSILVTRSLVAPLKKRVRSAGLLPLVVRTVAEAVVQAALVCGWTLGAIMVVRIFWAWVRQSPPLSERYYVGATNPWLPAVAAAAVLLRGWLTFKAADSKTRRSGIGGPPRAQEEPKSPVSSPRPLPSWMRQVATAFLMTLFLAGFIDSLLLGVAILLLITAILLGRAYGLPRLGPWRRWTAIIAKVPLLFRMAAVIVAGYLLTTLVLKLPGQSAAISGVPGKFGAEITSLILGLLVSASLLPQPLTVRAAGPAAGAPGGKRSGSPIFGPDTQVLLLLAFLALVSSKAYADICLDPVCCFGADKWALLAVIGILLLLLMVLLIMLLWEFLAAEALVAAAAEAADAAAVAAAEAEADAVAAEAIANAAAAADNLAAQAAAEGAAEGYAVAAQQAAQSAELAQQAAAALEAGNTAEASALAQQAAQAAQAAQDAAAQAARELSDVLGSLPPDQLGPAVTQALEGALQNGGADAARQMAENLAGDMANGPAALQATLNNINSALGPVSDILGSGGGVRTLQILQGIVRGALGLP